MIFTLSRPKSKPLATIPITTCMPGVKTRVKDFSAAMLLFFGIVYAGSDSPFFPWLNLLGVALLLGFARIAGARKHKRCKR